MEEEYQERSGFMSGVAKVLNAGGSAAVYTYDTTAGALKKVVEVAQKAPFLPQKAAEVFSTGLGVVKPREVKEVEARINEYEKKIKTLYFEIGKEGAKYSADENPLETEEVQKLITDVREHEKEIQRLETRIDEIKEQKKEKKKKTRAKIIRFAKKPSKASVEQVKKKVESAIDKAVKQGEFDNRSDREIFSKVAHDLLDNEMEIKILAAGELGKIKNNAGVPILLEALNFGDADLDIDIINSLIAIDDERAIPVFKEKVADKRFRVRIGCLRGLYKLADDQEATPFLMEALRDENAEVRRTAVTFIGWKDYDDAVPALVQCLRDEKTRVRKAAVSALANLKDESAVLPLIKVLADKNLEIRQKAFEAVQVISGKEITFDVNAAGKQLKEDVGKLRDWWQKERLSKTDVEAEEDVPEPETAAEEVAEPEADDAEDAMAEPEAMEPEEETLPKEAALTESELKKMTKAELVAICKERGLEFEEKQPKDGIIQAIMKG
jgi:hypothetical protein